jgi:hypothetical protein
MWEKGWKLAIYLAKILNVPVSVKDFCVEIPFWTLVRNVTLHQHLEVDARVRVK